MNYADIKWCDSGNGPGARVVIFVSGCRNKCPGCFNQETWDFEYGEELSLNIKLKIINWLNEHKYIDGVTIMGGEPMDPKNVEGVSSLIHFIREYSPSKTIWLYTGYNYESLIERSKEYAAIYVNATNYILKNIDVLVDGPFIIDKKNIKLIFRGSSNQRIIDMKQTISSGDIVLSKYNNIV